MGKTGFIRAKLANGTRGIQTKSASKRTGNARRCGRFSDSPGSQNEAAFPPLKNGGYTSRYLPGTGTETGFFTRKSCSLP